LSEAALWLKNILAHLMFNQVERQKDFAALNIIVQVHVCNINISGAVEIGWVDKEMDIIDISLCVENQYPSRQFRSKSASHVTVIWKKSSSGRGPACMWPAPDMRFAAQIIPSSVRLFPATVSNMSSAAAARLA
jgi:hypothetical protein